MYVVVVMYIAIIFTYTLPHCKYVVY